MKLTKENLTEHGACLDGMHWYLKNGEPKTVEKTIESLIKSHKEERFDWSNWLLSEMLNHDNKIRYAIFAAELVIDIFEKQYPKDGRPRKAIKAVKKYLDLKTPAARDAARDAAGAAEAAARAARDAAGAVAWDAVWAAWAARDAAGAAEAAWAAAGAAEAAAEAAVWAAWAAWAAGDAARAAAGAAWAAAGAAEAAARAARDAAGAAEAAARAARDAAGAAGDAYNNMLLKIINYGLSLINK